METKHVTNLLPCALKGTRRKGYALVFYYHIDWSLCGAFATLFILAVSSNCLGSESDL